MTNKSKRKGTDFEVTVRDYVKLWKPATERRSLEGNKDKGDLYIPNEKRFVLELKACKKFELAKWLEEARIEARNAGTDFGVVVHKRRMATVGESYVTMPLWAFMKLAYGDPVENS